MFAVSYNYKLFDESDTHILNATTPCLSILHVVATGAKGIPLSAILNLSSTLLSRVDSDGFEGIEHEGHQLFPMGEG